MGSRCSSKAPGEIMRIWHNGGNVPSSISKVPIVLKTNMPFVMKNDVAYEIVSRSKYALHLRIKMGICEGYPGSIRPDYQGRADYFGTSVNEAARFMDAGECSHDKYLCP